MTGLCCMHKSSGLEEFGVGARPGRPGWAHPGLPGPDYTPDYTRLRPKSFVKAMIRTPLISSFALTHSHTRFRCRTHAGSGDNPAPNDVRLP